MQISFLDVTAADAPRLAHIVLAPGQEAFVTLPVDRLSQLGAKEDGHAVVAGDRIVGFFVIDRDFAASHPFARPGEIGLRALAIDAAQQGRGIGRAVFEALPAMLALRYPGVAGAVLSVNQRNPRARDLYLRNGWQDGGELYHGGRSGPQHVLRLPLG
ncbi:GNAT family N-acetyltransferase [Acidimangrovimonas sediminis]|uniref:GNAT family N-acetyltransferase n=1 Tax=Acidimangrovimonas sediminis TaxID=2056283 RepID=UPI000C80A96E|nr:GNAT family N-acetyltransferase [Acidimangrovimonas sediminis]